jgi:hypothetical protein
MAWLLVRPICNKIIELLSSDRTFASLLEQFVLRLNSLHLILDLFLVFLLLLLTFNHLTVLTQKPFLSGNLHLQYLLLQFLLVASVLKIELFLPSQKVFRGDGCEGSEFRSFEDFHFFINDLFLLFVGLSFDEVLMYPVSGLFHNVENDWFLLTVDDDIIDFFGDCVDVIASYAGNGFQFVFDGSERVLLAVLEHETDLILELVPPVRLAQHSEFERRSLLQNCELVKVDVGQGVELVTLVTKMLNLGHFCKLLSPDINAVSNKFKDILNK